MREVKSLRPWLLASASAACVLSAAPASAQSMAAIRAAAGIPNPVASATAAAMASPRTVSPLGLIRDQGSAATRALATQRRMLNSVSLARQAQTAARGAAAALNPAVPSGLRPGGLQPAIDLSLAAQDLTGVRTWQGAALPTQSGTRVDIQQTESRALLSWRSFNVAADTTVNFIQGTGAVDAATGRPANPQTDWVALNRVVGQLDPATGRRDPTLAPAPSQILGRITGDGTVIVINANGVLFSGTSQVRTRSLIASSLEVGDARLALPRRNDEFLRLGLLGPGDELAPVFVTSFASAPAVVGMPLPEALIEGEVAVAAGADLALGESGLLLLAAPTVTNAGSLSVLNGQISLVGGRGFQLLRSTGTADSLDSNVRGLVVTGVAPSAAGDYVLNRGIIDSPRGYVSLVASSAGAVIHDGVITSSTSVSRNGVVDLQAADVRLAPSSLIAIMPDAGGETIPQAPDSVAGFKTSQVRVGGSAQQGRAGRIEIGRDALILAPSADIAIGGLPGGGFDGATTIATRVFIDTGATIDAGGIKDFLVPASRNAIEISPVKRNELRDTPTYREDFLNGATVFVDPRRSGVRADGVTWVGSPLIEAESFFQQVGVTAAELMTTGGSVTLGAGPFAEFGAGGARNDPALAPDIIVKPGASVDISGGWVRYEGGPVQTSQLITAGGRIVDIADADPNGDYVGLVNPFSTSQTRFGVTDAFDNGTIQGVRAAPEYTEGRDAGALTLRASAIAFDGALFAQAFAGDLQRGAPVERTLASTVFGDRRLLQGAASQIPAGGFLFVQAVADNANGTIVGDGGDIAIVAPGAIPRLDAALGFGQSVAIDAGGELVRPNRDPASLLAPARRDTILFADAALTDAGLGQLTLQTTGGLRFAPGTVTRLAPEGIVEGIAGRAITVAGDISAASGTIDLVTFNAPGGSVFADDPARAGSFDIAVGGVVSAAGRFVNDFGATPGAAEGASSIEGGAITLIAAPRVVLPGDEAGAFTDISGSIVVTNGALIDVAGGARVAPGGAIDTSARGGDAAFINQTNFFQLNRNLNFFVEGQITGFRFNLPVPLVGNAASNPAAVTARVSLAPGSVRGHGFGGGGVFTLTTPAFALGDTPATVGTALPLDFFPGAGFGAYDISVFKTALLPNRIVNALGGTNAVAAIETIEIGAGATLNLVQSQFSPLIDAASALALRQLATGGDLYSVETPIIPAAAFDQRPVDLALGGLTELVVAPGGRIEGAGGATIAAPRLLNEGAIRIAGGTIAERDLFLPIYTDATAIGVRDLGEVFAIEPDGDIVETAINVAGISNGARLLTNAEVALTRTIFFLGRLDQGEGVRLDGAGVTDLSGASLRNPRATTPAGVPITDGRLLPGGTLTTASARLRTDERAFTTPRFGTSVLDARNAESNNVPLSVAGRALIAEPGARIGLAGAADSYSRLNAGGVFAPTPQWSDGGRLGIGNDGTIAGALITASGGAPLATGGTLTLANPVLRQSDPAAPSPSLYAADAIEASGFDTLVVEGALDTDGDVSLALDRGFFLRSLPFDGLNFSGPRYATRIGATGDLAIAAPVIRLTSILQAVPDIALGIPGDGTLSLTANALDIEGAVLVDRSLASARLEAAADLRLVGARPPEQTLGNPVTTVANSLAGQLVASGDLALAAAQVYATTGSSVLIASTAADGAITFARTTAAAPATPYSAGSSLTVQAATITHGGVIRAPLGQLTLGGNAPIVSPAFQTLAPATNRLSLTAGSITSVSANGLVIPFGTTTDQVEYFFTPTIAAALTAPPAAVLRLGGETVALDPGATVDITGGGDVYAYEFIPGTGGSRDVLDRFNSDPFSSKTGFQYPDARQVYAIVPGLADAGLALVDPIYSADYAPLYDGDQAGRRVFLNAAPGLAAGWYTLLPARYALLPGGLRIVEQPEYGPAPATGAAQLRDGSLIVGGYFGTAGTDLRQSELTAFNVQSQSSFRGYSRIATTPATATFAARAARNGLVAPRLPIDSGRLILDAIRSLTVDATVLTAPAPGGRAAAADINGTDFAIVGAAAADPLDDVITLTTATLANLNVASLLIGGTRTDNADGTTNLLLTGRSILVDNDFATPLTAPEILLGVDGEGASITLADGASIIATGAPGDPRAGDYILDGSSPAMTGNGALLRVSTGPERLVRRVNREAVFDAATLDIGLARLRGPSVLLDSTGDLAIASPATGAADIVAGSLVLGASEIAFTGDPVASGLVVTPALQAALAAANRLTIRTPAAIGFSPGTYAFGTLTLDTPGLGLILPATAAPMRAVAITTGALRLSNAAAPLAPCLVDCGDATLSVAATSILFGSGTLAAPGFGGGVTFGAPGGIAFDGVGGFDAGAAPLTVATPRIADQARALAPGEEALLPSLTLATRGALAVTAPAPLAAAADGTPGARLALIGDSVRIAGTRLRATAGALEVRATGPGAAAAALAIADGAILETPGYARVFGDAADPYSLTAPGGRLRLIADAGAIDAAAGTRLSVGGATGQAGTLDIRAAGEVDLLATLDATGTGGAFTLDSGGALDLATLSLPAAFDRLISLRARTGDLALAQDRTLAADTVRLTADTGLVTIAGTIDASGINGGEVALAGAGVTLASTALIDATATGYAATDSRQAKGGDVRIATTGSGAIAIEAGAVIDVGADRPSDRLIADIRNQQVFYRLAQGDQGGTVHLRAPLIEQSGPDTARVTVAGAITGARAVTLEAFKSFDLATLAGFTGVTIAGTTATLDTRAPGNNFLAGTGPGALPAFIQGFDISAAIPGLGALAAAPEFHARPGVELVFAGDIILASNLNLAAGVVDVAGATAAGLFTPRPGTPALAVVVPGQEGRVFNEFTRLTYRVGGSVDGEPGILTLRAGGALTVRGAISDGFFALRDQTNPEYINFALGGGQRTFQPILRPQCPTQVCADAPVFDAAAPPPSEAIVFRFGATQVSGDNPGVTGLLIDAPAPYAAANNTPAAQGTGGASGAGDALGTAEAFPLLASGDAAESWSLRLVGGSDLASPDPLGVAPGATGSVRVNGESSYSYQRSRGTESFTGALVVDPNAGTAGTPRAPVTPDRIVAELVANEGADPAAYTLLGLDAPTAVADTFLQTRAAAFFALQPAGQYSFVSPAQVATTLTLAGAFIESIAADYAALLGARQAGVAPPGGGPTPLVTEFVRSVVRTGTGSIDIAAAGDIDTRVTIAAVTRPSGSAAQPTQPAQVGGTAIYTAGARSTLAAITAADPLGGLTRRVDPTVFAQTSSLFATTGFNAIAPLRNALAATPIYLDGGGDVSLAAGGDVLGRRDIQGAFRLTSGAASPFIGAADQPWRIGEIGVLTDIRVNPQLFQTGIGTLGGGDIRIVAGRDIVDLALAANTSVLTAEVLAGDALPTRALVTLGGGDVTVTAGRDLAGGQFDLGQGALEARVGGDLRSPGTVAPAPAQPLISNALRVRLTDAFARFEVAGLATVRGVAALGIQGYALGFNATPTQNARGFYTPAAGIAVRANGRVTFETVGPDVVLVNNSTLNTTYGIYPGTLEAASLTGDLVLGPPGSALSLFLYPSPAGQLRLFAGADITPVSLAMDDGDPGLLPGYFSTFVANPEGVVLRGRAFGFPAVLSDTSETDRRALHNPTPTHIANREPARVGAGNDITDMILSLPKEGRVSAGRDIVNMALTGQNLRASDITRVLAGRDIVGATGLLAPRRGLVNLPPLPAVLGNVFIVGGPGALMIDAGRDAGPFLNSAVATSVDPGGRLTARQTYGGGVLSVGNEYNPWLAPVGADVLVQFGVGRGVNYSGFRDRYVDPANVAALEDDLFVQSIDQFGGFVADRSQPIYAPILIAWLRSDAAGELSAAYRAIAEPTFAQAYAEFRALPELRQRVFLTQEVYFNELVQTSIPTSVSYLRYSRGYEAVNTLFPPALGYTANDLSGGGNTGTTPVETGNLDLRLATIQTARAGDVAILGPGGRVLGGSTVRTSAQAERRAFAGNRVARGFGATDAVLSQEPFAAVIDDIPTGFEGFLTLRGGRVQSFTDGDFLLNQSRLFTQGGGNVELFSANGDLNAGQGPKTSANFPPVVVRISPNGVSEVDVVGGVSGAGIAAFQPAPGVEAPDVFLIAPRGTVDAGDAGVRVAGNLFVAALAVANADNFAVGGTAFGIPSGPVVNVAAQAAGNAASAAAAQAAAQTANATSRRSIDPLSRISVDVLGYGGSDPCDQEPRPASCPPR